MKNFIEQLDLYFGKKAPQLPAGFKEALVKFAPYLAIVGAVIMAFTIFPMVLLVLGVGGLSALVGNYAGVASMGGVLFFFAVSVIAEIMIITAIPGLFAKTESAWNTLFYAQLLIIVAGLLQSYNIVGAIINFVIGMYFLFQVRSYYTGLAQVGMVSSGPSVPPPMPPTPPLQ